MSDKPKLTLVPQTYLRFVTGSGQDLVFDTSSEFSEWARNTAASAEKLTTAKAALQSALEWYNANIKLPEEKQSGHPVAVIIIEALKKIEEL